MIRNMQDVWPNIFGAFGEPALQEMIDPLINPQMKG